jgi:hypothetical protein
MDMDIRDETKVNQAVGRSMASEEPSAAAHAGAVAEFRLILSNSLCFCLILSFSLCCCTCNGYFFLSERNSLRVIRQDFVS